MTPQYGMIGKFITEPENRDVLIDILLQAAKLMQALDACHHYLVNKDADDPTAVWIFETWKSQEAHDKSLTMPEVRELIGQAMPLIVGGSSGINLVPVGKTS